MTLRSKILSSAAFFVGLATLIPCRPAGAQVLTIDPAQIIQVAKTAINTAQEVQQLIQLGQQVYGMAQSIGNMGPMELATFAIRHADGLADLGPRFQISDILPAFGGATSWTNPDGSTGRLEWTPPNAGTWDSPAKTAEWIRSNFYARGRTDLNTSELAAYRQLRTGNLRRTTVNAFGTAAHIRAVQTEVQKTQEALAREAASAVDLRGDVKANTSVLLQIHQQVAILNGILAAEVEMHAAGMIANDDVAPQSN